MPDLSSLKLVTKDSAVRVEVRARPRANKSRIVGVREGALEVQLAAPPVDGAANAELTKTLAAAAGLPKGAVRIVRGETGRNKLVEIAGVSEAELRERLERTTKS